MLLNQPNNAPAVMCLRCSATVLRVLPESTQEVAFFDCPACLRHYARKKGGALTYRWLHPVSLALYGVIFESLPVAHARRIAESLKRDRRADEVLTLVEEIELEIERPTQQVRDILGNVASETHCRAFLAAVAQELRLA